MDRARRIDAALAHIEEAVRLGMDPHEIVQGIYALGGLGIVSMPEWDEEDEDQGYDFDVTLDMLAYHRFLSDDVPADKVETVKTFMAHILDRNDKKDAATPQ